MASLASCKYTAVTEQIASYTILPFNFTFIAVILDCSVKLGGDAQTWNAIIRYVQDHHRSMLELLIGL